MTEDSTEKVVKEPAPVPTPSFGDRVWTSLKSAASWVGTKALGPILVVVLVVVGIILVSMGFKELQIGGLIGKLLGKKDPKGEGNTVDLANTVDPDRIGPDGKLIQPGTPDSKGMTQAVVVPIKEPGLFSDPKKVVFTEPGKDKPTEITLPDGVTNKDVDQVVVVRPDVTVVTVKDKSGIPAKTVDDLLLKYGK
jgi:hypothetical protein